MFIYELSILVGALLTASIALRIVRTDRRSRRVVWNGF